MAERRLR